MFLIIRQALVVGLLTGGIYGLFAVGLSLIMGIAGIMTFVHGDFLMLAMYATFLVSEMTGLGIYATIPLVVIIIFLLGMETYQYLPAVKKILKHSQMKQMLYMLGFSYFLQNTVLMIAGAAPRTMKSPITKYSPTIGGVFISLPRLIAGFASVVLTLALMWFLNNTDLGLSIKAVSQNRNAAEMMGVNAHRTYMLAWAIGLGLLGFAGPMLTPIYSFYPLEGNYYLMIGFMCVVLGGLGNILGALIGGLVMGVALELGNIFMPGSSGPVIPFLVFIIVLLFKPEGLLSKGLGRRV